MNSAVIPAKADLLADLKSDSAVELFSYLYSRWMDEREYEDFADYVKHVQKRFPTCFVGKKRPFEFRFNAEGCVLIVRVTSRAISYASISKERPHA